MSSQNYRLLTFRFTGSYPCPIYDKNIKMFPDDTSVPFLLHQNMGTYNFHGLYVMIYRFRTHNPKVNTLSVFPHI